MKHTRITLMMLEDELNALLQLAQQERRDFRDQAVLLIRESLERRGLLPIVNATPNDTIKAQQTGAANYATT